MDLLAKYAHLLATHCLSLNEGEKLYLSTTTLAEPLVKEIYRQCCKMGVLMEYNMSFADKGKIYYEDATETLLNIPSPFQTTVMKEFDAYMVIKAPFNLREDQNNDKEKQKIRNKTNTEINQTYFDRTADGSLKRTLCLYPTQASAQEAGMSLEEYSSFVFHACKLYQQDPVQAWKDLGNSQQHIVDYLNQSDSITYKNDKTDVTFSVKGRTWINSDGKANMPSGEVFTGPIEDSVNGTVHFDYPSIYNGNEVRDITLEIENGIIKKWSAAIGQSFLDHIMEIEGARMFGEVAVGTNYDINIPTKNILFDEKIGGTIHMAIGQSYKQTGGVNMSSVHWDMIAGMQHGEIIADGKVIYKNGKFIL
jgi:aminopeptidase